MNALLPLEMSSLELNGPLGDRIRLTWRGNLKMLDWQRDFLAPFREKRPAGTYVGMGKTLAGLVRTAELLGGEADELRRRIVAELLDAQEEDGYLGLYRPEDRTRRLWDVHEQSYILQALVENWRVSRDQRSLEGARRLARWMLPRLEGGRWRGVGERQVWSPLALIGLDRAMLRVGEAAGLDGARPFVAQDLGVEHWFAPIVEGRQGGVDGHIYAYLARCLAQLELDSGHDVLPPATEAALGYLIAGGGLAVSGGAGQEECWEAEQRVDGKLGETCATAYLLRWWEALERRTGSCRFADLAERALYNALFAALSPDGRRIRYYTPLEGERSWHPGDTYCCPGNFRRIVSELARAIWHRFSNGLALSLFEPCAFRCEAGGATVDVTVETAYPFGGEVTIGVDPSVSARFPLAVRLPRWCPNATVEIPGESPRIRAGGGWEVVERRWDRGDRLEIRLDMPWRLVRGIRGQRGRVALMRGPVLWAAGGGSNPAHSGPLGSIAPRLASCALVGSEAPLCRLRGTTPTGAETALELAPFHDPGGTATYFRGSLEDESVPDELLAIAAPPPGVSAAPPA